MTGRPSSRSTLAGRPSSRSTMTGRPSSRSTMTGRPSSRSTMTGRQSHSRGRGRCRHLPATDMLACKSMLSCGFHDAGMPVFENAAIQGVMTSRR